MCSWERRFTFTVPSMLSSPRYIDSLRELFGQLQLDRMLDSKCGGGGVWCLCHATAISSCYLLSHRFFFLYIPYKSRWTRSFVSYPSRTASVSFGVIRVCVISILFSFTEILRDKSKIEIKMLIFKSIGLKIILSRSYPREIAHGFKLFISSKELLSNCKKPRSQK